MLKPHTGFFINLCPTTTTTTTGSGSGSGSGGSSGSTANVYVKNPLRKNFRG